MDHATRADGGALIAAGLHDAVKDRPHGHEDVAVHFGPRMAEIFRETSDGISPPKDSRHRASIAAMPHKSPAARIVTTADVISNLRAMAISLPAA